MEESMGSRDTLEGTTTGTVRSYNLSQVQEFEDEFFEEIREDEEALNVVYEIREELMDRVMDEIYKFYLDEQTIRFVVQCAYEAMLKFLSIAFYYHDPIPNTSSPQWKPDEPIPPSPPDTWAAGSVAVRRKCQQPKTDFESHASTKADSVSMVATPLCPCIELPECLCTDTGPNLDSLDFNNGSTNSLSTRPLSEMLAGSLLSDHSASGTSGSKPRTSSKQGRKPKMSSVTSIKNYEPEEMPAYFQFTAGQKRQISIIRKLPRKSIREDVKLPKIELPTYKVKDSKTSLLELPPIRYDPLNKKTPGRSKFGHL